MANKIIVSGKITKPEFSHETYDEKFYQFFISTERKSGTMDILPVIASECFLDDLTEGERILIEGEVRTWRKCKEEEGKSKLEIIVFVKQIFEPCEFDQDLVEIDAFICKEPVYRETPFGREVTDVRLASNRAYKRRDYIPSIAWGRKARIVASMPMGTKLLANGRLQSREYVKKYKDGTEELKVAYELSLSSVKIIEEEEENG